MGFKYLSNDDRREKAQKSAASVFRHIKYAVFLVPIMYFFWPEIFPIHPVGGFWFIKGDIFDWVIASKWMLGWALFGFAARFIAGGTSKSDGILAKKVGPYAPLGKRVLAAFSLSFEAGVIEEFLYRWILVFGSIPVLIFSNYIFGGFIGDGWGIPRWFYETALCPLANWTSFGYCKAYLLHPTWYMAGAFVSANIMFRDGHSYQGVPGLISSWFAGIFLLYITMTYGIVIAMAIHFTYDMILFTAEALFSRSRQSELKPVDQIYE